MLHSSLFKHTIIVMKSGTTVHRDSVRTKKEYVNVVQAIAKGFSVNKQTENFTQIDRK